MTVHNTGVNSKKINLILIGISIVLIYSIYYNSIDNYNIDTLKILGFFSLIQLMFILLSWKRLTGSFFDAYTIFMVACYAFNLAQPILEVFGAVSPKRSIITHYEYPINIYCQATYISMYFIMTFHFGSISVYKVTPSTKIKNYKSNYEIQLKAIFKVASVFAILSFPGYIYNMMVNMILSATEGYGAIYMEGSGTVKIFDLIGEYYVPALICLYFASEGLNNHKNIVLSIIVLTVIVPPLIIGGRTGMMVMFAILLLLYFFFHKVNKRKILIMGVGVYVVLLVFAVMAGNRGSGLSGYTSENLYDKEDKGNPVLFTLSEMGASVQPLMRTMNIIPENQNFRYGESYLYALTTIVPNVGIWDIHPATKHSNLGKWLQEYYNLPFGPGFSIVAEAYYNFGYYGFLMMFILGCGFTKMLLFAQKKFIKINPTRTVMAIVFLWLTVKMVRNSFEFVVRALVYYYLPMYWLIKYTAIKFYQSNNPKTNTYKLESSIN